MWTRAFASDRQGATAIEFALVLPLLIGIIVGTVEIGIVGLVSNTLDNSVQAASRKIRVGDTGAPTSASEFRDAVCSGMFEPRNSCLAKLNVSVRKFSNFASASAAAGDAPANQFDRGGEGDIILVKATYRWPFFMPFFTLDYQQSGAAAVLLDARTTFKNEPFG
ncbi:TadE/TadG family type IV pilus assembly protein [Phenylobacterium soli]|uniref:TadE-like domain-containing protein n=1 Tax=Phenylobacterium soli TaxID=2170551 RepID=A0A328AL65_9CAUL|nr:TadE/TadG family type IV pilus assembly protein [Phenylobacterium soli]RAK55297.1 hypothetical protein DJ017_12630 [Phenylobacterium soli]